MFKLSKQRPHFLKKLWVVFQTCWIWSRNKTKKKDQIFFIFQQNTKILLDIFVFFWWLTVKFIPRKETFGGEAAHHSRSATSSPRDGERINNTSLFLAAVTNTWLMSSRERVCVCAHWCVTESINRHPCSLRATTHTHTHQSDQACLDCQQRTPTSLFVCACRVS